MVGAWAAGDYIAKPAINKVCIDLAVDTFEVGGTGGLVCMLVVNGVAVAGAGYASGKAGEKAGEYVNDNFASKISGFMRGLIKKKR